MISPTLTASERYHEPLVHQALARLGEELLASPEFVVDELRDDLTLRTLLEERVAWGRLFGALRVRDASPAKRLLLTCLSPLLPALLFARILKGQLAKGVPLARVAGVAPAVVILLCAWAVGEAAGYATGRA